MSKQQERTKEQRATEEIASATQPTHYNVTPQEKDLEDKRTPEATGQAAQNSIQDLPATSTHGANIHAQPPVEISGLKIKGTGAGAAGGIPAIVQTVKHAWREMGARRSLK